MWVITFSLVVGLIAFYLGIGYAVAILCVRHILWGVPSIFGYWVKLVYGNDEYEKYLEKKKSGRLGNNLIIESITCIAITIVIFIWFNIKLVEVFTK